MEANRTLKNDTIMVLATHIFLYFTFLMHDLNGSPTTSGMNKNIRTTINHTSFANLEEKQTE